MKALLLLLCVLLLLLLSAVACKARAPDVTTTRHREAARVVLETHCHLCHLPDANGDEEFRVAGGLATHIFDLRSDDWSASLSDPQLDEAVRKLVDAGASADEVATLERFVADEHAWRDAHPAHYPRELRDRALLAP